MDPSSAFLFVQLIVVEAAKRLVNIKFKECSELTLRVGTTRLLSAQIFATLRCTGQVPAPINGTSAAELWLLHDGKRETVLN
jgi:hypothetical protein